MTDDKKNPEVEERRKGDRRVSTVDRRASDRVVEKEPRRKNPDRRKK